jgi:hypothetical protein
MNTQPVLRLHDYCFYIHQINTKYILVSSFNGCISSFLKAYICVAYCSSVACVIAMCCLGFCLVICVLFVMFMFSPLRVVILGFHSLFHMDPCLLLYVCIMCVCVCVGEFFVYLFFPFLQKILFRISLVVFGLVLVTFQLLCLCSVFVCVIILI